MADTEDSMPEFSGPTISAGDLNKVARAAGRDLAVSGPAGAAVKRGGKNQTILLPRIRERITVRVYACDSGSGGGSPSGSCSGPGPCGSSPDGFVPYRWVEQTPSSCGGWVDMPGGKVGDPLLSPAYEYNDDFVEDGSIQEIEPRHVWKTNSDGTGYFVIEWRFKAGGGGGLPITTVSFPVCISVVELDDLS